LEDENEIKDILLTDEQFQNEHIQQMIASGPTRPPLSITKKRKYDEMQQSLNQDNVPSTNISGQNQPQNARKRCKTHHNNNISNKNTSSSPTISPSNNNQQQIPSNTIHPIPNTPTTTTNTAQNAINTTSPTTAPSTTANTDVMKVRNNKYQCRVCNNIFTMNSFMYKSGIIKKFMNQWTWIYNGRS